MIPTNLTLSSQLGLSQGLSEALPEESLGLQLTELSEESFAEFFLTQFPAALTTKAEPAAGTEELTETGKSLPLLPTLLATDPEQTTLDEIATNVEEGAVLPVIPAPVLNKQVATLETEGEITEPLKKLILEARPEQKEIQTQLKEQQPNLAIEKPVVEKATLQKADLIIPAIVDKTDNLKVIEKAVLLNDKPLITSTTSTTTTLESTPLRPLPLPTTTTNQTPVQVNLDTPFAQAKWGESLAGRVMWMMAENHTSAKINLNPAELGPIEVRVSVNNDQTNVNFVAQHGVTRDAIEDAFPRLREMFSQNGINLGEANVSDQSLANKGNAQQEFSGSEQGKKYHNDSVSELSEDKQEGQSLQTQGIVDQFV